MPVWMLGVRIHNPHGSELDQYRLEHDVIHDVFDSDTVDTVAERHAHEPGRFNRMYTQKEVDDELATLKKKIAVLEKKVDRLDAALSRHQSEHHEKVLI